MATAMSELILKRTDGHVGIATLNRPEVLNALSVELMDMLIDVLEGFDRDENIYVIVLAGSERAFELSQQTIGEIVADGGVRSADDLGQIVRTIR